MDGARVVVEVLAYDIDRTVINIEASKYGVSKGDTAAKVMNSILDRLR